MDLSVADAFRPIGEYALVEVLPEKEVSPAGVVIPDIHYLHKFRRGVVLRVGSRAAKRGLEPGQVVYFAKEHFDHGTQKVLQYLLKEGGRQYHILKWYDFLFAATDPADAPEVR